MGAGMEGAGEREEVTQGNRNQEEERRQPSVDNNNNTREQIVGGVPGAKACHDFVDGKCRQIRCRIMIREMSFVIRQH